MFRREAVWIQINELGPTWSPGTPCPAVKLSIGGRSTLFKFAENQKVFIMILGVNAVSGVSTCSIEPPKFGAEQDYVVVGQQP